MQLLFWSRVQQVLLLSVPNQSSAQRFCFEDGLLPSFAQCCGCWSPSVPFARRRAQCDDLTALLKEAEEARVREAAAAGERPDTTIAHLTQVSS
jgi:hypothetical protein